MQIESKIVGWNIVKGQANEQPKVVQQERPEVLTAYTYKVKNINGIGFYITISDLEIDFVNENQKSKLEIENENQKRKYLRRPYEIFINSKCIDSYCYITTITRLISAFLRTGHDYEFIAEELKQIIDPKNGNYFKKGKNYLSFIAEIGEIVEKHFKNVAEHNAKMLNDEN